MHEWIFYRGMAPSRCLGAPRLFTPNPTSRFLPSYMRCSSRLLPTVRVSHTRSGACGGRQYSTDDAQSARTANCLRPCGKFCADGDSFVNARKFRHGHACPVLLLRSVLGNWCRRRKQNSILQSFPFDCFLLFWYSIPEEVECRSSRRDSPCHPTHVAIQAKLRSCLSRTRKNTPWS